MKRPLVWIALLLLLTSCGRGPLGSSQVELLLTDAPAGEANSLPVTFGRIDLVPADGDEDGITTISDSAGEVDVLTLRNGDVESLTEADVPAGTYDQIRLVVEEAHVHFQEESFPVTVPSGEETGLKINVEPPLIAEAGETSRIVLDFDVERAVIETPPGSSNYLLKPTGLRAVTESGVLQGTVVGADGGGAVDGASISVYRDDAPPVTSAIADEEGAFRIITLVEGTYDVEIAADGYAPELRQEVSITAGATTDLGEVSLAPEAP